MIVLKVGGSLYDLPDLAQRLRFFLATLHDPHLLLVPGGGEAADAVRNLDRIHGLGPVRSHWLALRVCSMNGHFLASLLDCPVTAEVDGAQSNRKFLAVLDSFTFCEADESREGRLPHCWEATSDSVAARVAIVGQGELVLLKSVTIPPALSWEEAAKEGFVDPIVPGLIRRHGLRARAVNLRDFDS